MFINNRKIYMLKIALSYTPQRGGGTAKAVGEESPDIFNY